MQALVDNSKVSFENIPDPVQEKKGEQHLYKCRITVYSNIIRFVAVGYEVWERPDYHCNKINQHGKGTAV